MKKNGFTLLETLIAITILTLAVAGPLFTADRAIVAAQIAKDQLTASYLAQEGIEYIRQLRDNDYLAGYSAGLGTGWQSFTNDITKCVSTLCTLDTSKGNAFSAFTQTLSQCTGSCISSPPPLYLAASGAVNYYSQSQTVNALGQAYPKTSFQRVIQAIPLPSSANPTEYHITSTVTWTFHSSTYSVVIGDNLTPWQ